MRDRLAVPWGDDRDFLKRWSGQTISLLSSQVTQLALPLTAVLTLGATPLQMGILHAAPWLPALAIGILASVLLLAAATFGAGAWVYSPPFSAGALGLHAAVGRLRCRSLCPDGFGTPRSHTLGV